jgi:cyclophilin family peptidyl-prolyl cis-trans isomerase
MRRHHRAMSSRRTTSTAPDRRHAEDEGLEIGTPISVTIETSCGDLVFELEPGIAPLAVNSFVFLARQGYYDGQVSHRIYPGFMFQAGDQTASGVGNPGYLILRDEWPAEGFAYDRGVLAMANAGPSSTGSQFFVMLDDYSLPPNYTVIGRLVGGDPVLDDIAAVPVTARPNGEESLPLEALYIERIVVGSGG